MKKGKGSVIGQSPEGSGIPSHLYTSLPLLPNCLGKEPEYIDWEAREKRLIHGTMRKSSTMSDEDFEVTYTPVINPSPVASGLH